MLEILTTIAMAITTMTCVIGVLSLIQVIVILTTRAPTHVKPMTKSELTKYYAKQRWIS